MKLAYLTTCFGTPSHTFIRRELRRFEELGMEVILYGIRKDNQLSNDSLDLVARTRYLYPVRIAQTAYLNARFCAQYPSRYSRCVVDSLSPANGSWKDRLKLLYHLALSVSHAQDALTRGVTHIHAHFLHAPSTIAMFCSRLTQIPFSITIHSAGERGQAHVLAIPLKLRHAAKLIMISQFNIDYYESSYPCRDKSVVVRCGMAIDELPFEPADALSADKIKLLAVGRMVEKKGFEYLIEAAALLRDQGFPFVLTILGYGPLEQDLQRRVQALGLQDCVSLPGKASSAQVQKQMAESDIVVVPSVTGADGGMEGIPVVIMEAMALGVPVIATRHSGIPEVVTPETGTLVPERDAAALAAAIRDFKFDQPRVLRARALVEREFDIHKVVETRLGIFSDPSRVAG